MSTMTQPERLWSSMPGWGIAADLTPSELVDSRQLKRLRKLVAIALVTILAICAGGYVLAAQKHAAAADELDVARARTTQLQVDSRRYSGVVAIKGTTAQVRAQIATLMTGDVDLVKLMARIRTGLPATMTIGQESVMISIAGVASAQTTQAGPGLDTSGHAKIGTVTLSGSSKTLDDLSAYVDALERIPGVIDVVPLSNVNGANGVKYSVSLGLTDVLVSHRFGVSKTGGQK